MQVYTAKSPGQAPGKNQDMRVVLDMAEGLHANDITCDHFFSHHTPCKVVQTKGWNVPSGGLPIGENAGHILPMLFVFCQTHIFY